MVIRRYLLGTLLKKGPLLRITSTIRLAEITDSMNQPVLNKTSRAFKNQKKHSKGEIIKNRTRIPKTIMKLRMKPTFQRRGCSTISLSTLSVPMVVSGKSVIRLVSKICPGRRGRKDRKRDAPAMLNMFPKFALVAMNTYFRVLAKVFLPSFTPFASTPRVLFKQDNISSFFGNIYCAFNRDTDICRMKSGGIVDSIAHVPHHISRFLKCENDPFLLVWFDLCENVNLIHLLKQRFIT